MEQHIFRQTTIAIKMTCVAGLVESGGGVSTYNLSQSTKSNQTLV